MAERQLRSRRVALEFEVASRDLEGCRNSNELDCQVTKSELLENEGNNTQFDKQISNGERQLPDNQVSKPEKSNHIFVHYIPSKMFRRAAIFREDTSLLLYKTLKIKICCSCYY
jgi:hypothetical protein